MPIVLADLFVTLELFTKEIGKQDVIKYAAIGFGPSADGETSSKLSDFVNDGQLRTYVTYRSPDSTTKPIVELTFDQRFPYRIGMRPMIKMESIAVCQLVAKFDQRCEVRRIDGDVETDAGGQWQSIDLKKLPEGTTAELKTRTLKFKTNIFDLLIRSNRPPIRKAYDVDQTWLIPNRGNDEITVELIESTTVGSAIDGGVKKTRIQELRVTMTLPVAEPVWFEVTPKSPEE